MKNFLPDVLVVAPVNPSALAVLGKDPIDLGYSVFAVYASPSKKLGTG